MRVQSSLLWVVAPLLATSLGTAQSGHNRAVTLGLTAVQPVPPWNDAGFGLAPWAGFAMPAWSNWSVGLRAGWIGHLNTEQQVGSETIRYSNWELPVLAGIEYWKASEHGVLFAAEFGYVCRYTRAEYRYESASTETDHGVGLAVGGGYRVKDLQLRVQLFMLGLPDPLKHKALMFGVQWNLPLRAVLIPKLSIPHLG